MFNNEQIEKKRKSRSILQSGPDTIAESHLARPTPLFRVFVYSYVWHYHRLQELYHWINNPNCPLGRLSVFKEFLHDPALMNVMRNTLILNGMALVFSFPAPIILALLINEIKSLKFKKIIQTISYLPHFLSWVIFGGIVIEILLPTGFLSTVLCKMGFLKSPVNFMAKGEYFYVIYTIISTIKSVGFGSILYVAAITGIDQELYEAATVDGCGRFQKMLYITLPCITGTIVIMLIFQISSMLNTGYEQIILLQNPLNLAYSETLDTYVYKIGIAQSRSSYAAAVGLLKSVLSVILMVSANKLSKKIVGRGLF